MNVHVHIRLKVRMRERELSDGNLGISLTDRGGSVKNRSFTTSTRAYVLPHFALAGYERLTLDFVWLRIPGVRLY